MLSRSTIFALSSGRPPAAIAVVRVCGANAGGALTKLIGRVPQPRQATLARVHDPQSGDVIDEALALWFPAPHSETGEDMAELQLHGGHAIIAAVLDALGRIENCRPAEPGEFTRRAFENGRLDLTAVEGLADLIAAETPAQRRQAFRQLKGLIGDRAEAWRRALIEALALVEARIDFADEADVPEDLIAPALTAAKRLREEIAAALADGGRGERLRDGLVVAIAGPPNSGKSTLLNRLARREAAIVSPYAGTTRDVIEVHLDLRGYPVTLVDTAGIRESDDPVELEGIRRARERAAAADLVLWVSDASAAGTAAAEVGQCSASSDMWVLKNKIDLAADSLAAKSEWQSGDSRAPAFAISAKTGKGVDGLVTALAAHARDYFSGAEPAMVTRLRHRRALEETVAALDRAIADGKSGREELIAEELRAAATMLGRLTGRVDVEDILDVIFRDFCIGK
ncbi:MAG TPA: tRNA uridine-5-carboxymethylaminomethyl(34) synthesis GTPase MnmE [Xanthobacteraceae bacterium]|nr:tRNA uridine-5-carboxymethylaminomethyl(34) synthesis GTPase MnmE [Xanthobacteraceae bacterium]